MKTTVKILLVVMIGVALTTGGGWASEKEMPQSGFLQDYSLLKPADPLKRADWLYVNEKVDMSAYDKIILDDVVFFLKDDAPYKGIEVHELQDLGDAFHKAIIMNLIGVYTFTDKPGPGVMRARIAITNLVPSKSVAGTVTTIIPQGLVVSAAKKVATGSHIGMGEVSFEAELIDSQTGEVLGAEIDSKTGKKYKVAKTVTKWGHAIDVFNFWARGLRMRLDIKSGRE